MVIDGLTQADIKVCKWQYKMLGDFYTSLFQTMIKADDDNLDKLEKAFPEEVGAYKRYQRESGYWPRIEAIWKKATSREEA